MYHLRCGRGNDVVGRIAYVVGGMARCRRRRTLSPGPIRASAPTAHGIPLTKEGLTTRKIKKKGVSAVSTTIRVLLTLTNQTIAIALTTNPIQSNPTQSTNRVPQQ